MDAPAWNHRVDGCSGLESLSGAQRFDELWGRMSEYQNIFAGLAIVSPAVVVVLGAVWAVCVGRLSKRMLIIIVVAFVLCCTLSNVIRHIL